MNDNDARERAEMFKRARIRWQESYKENIWETMADFALIETEAAQARIRDLEDEAERLKGGIGGTCEWSWDLDGWAAGCNYRFSSEDGTLAENQIYFCPNCGGWIVDEA